MSLLIRRTVNDIDCSKLYAPIVVFRELFLRISWDSHRWTS